MVTGGEGHSGLPAGPEPFTVSQTRSSAGHVILTFVFKNEVVLLSNGHPKSQQTNTAPPHGTTSLLKARSDLRPSSLSLGESRDSPFSVFASFLWSVSFHYMKRLRSHTQGDVFHV